MKILKLAAIPALALAASAFAYAPAANAATAPCTHSCGATIKITGAYVNQPVGYYPTPAGQVITANATATFSKTGTDVTDFRLLVDKKLVPEQDTAFGSGTTGVVYGSYTTGAATNYGDYNNGSPLIPGTTFPVKAGTHSLTYEIIGIKGAVLATSAAYTVTVPKQAAAVKPKLTYSISNPNVQTGGCYTATGEITTTCYYGSSINVSSSSGVIFDAPNGVLTFTLPAGDTLLDNNGGATQSGSTVTIPYPNTGLYGMSASYGQPFQFDYTGTALTTSTVTLDGISATPAA